MSNPLAANAIDALQRLHRQMDQALEGLPDEAMDWKPAEAANSLSVLASHTAGAQRYWIGTMVGRKPTDRVRDSEFETTGLTAAQARRLLADALEESEEVLAQLSLEDLGTAVRSPAHQREFQVAFSVVHAIEHTAEHTGHIELTRQLWDQSRSAAG